MEYSHEITSNGDDISTATPLRHVMAIGVSYVATFALGVLTTFVLVIVLINRMPAQAVAIATVPTPEPSPAANATEMPVVNVQATLNGSRDSMRMGSPQAPVQIVIFADPQCPFCKKSATETDPQIIDQYVKTGKASLVYRHFTFLGPESQRIAIAMECAAQQGRFWEFHQRVFDNQFPENSGQATDEALRGWAKDAGVDVARFTDCTGKPDVAAQVDADTAAGRRLGVVGTPTLFVNGRPMPGALPFDFLKTTIDTQLASAQNAPARTQ